MKPTPSRANPVDAAIEQLDAAIALLTDVARTLDHPKASKHFNVDTHERAA